jgi:hypothetical protein
METANFWAAVVESVGSLHGRHWHWKSEVARPLDEALGRAGHLWPLPNMLQESGPASHLHSKGLGQRIFS